MVGARGEDTGGNEAGSAYVFELELNPSSVDQVSLTMVEEFELHQNYPNPFNPTTTISFAVRKTAKVTLVIYNLQGQLVKTVLSGRLAAGQHQAIWDGRDQSGKQVASGIYLYRLSGDGFRATRKLIFTK